MEESTYALAIPATIDLNSKSSLEGSNTTKFQIKSLTYKVNVGENGIRDQFPFDQTEGAPASNYGA
ncbi:hypothetical protein [Patiriisocius sp. Uisw_017]|jgi:hypothetical protein|uniref:hypothetical protein n=1 Tax=Patiriisocius sp. Uisw_017 TaxID=3230968 RepID=UPI0039EC3E0D